MTGSRRLERFADDLRNVGAQTEADMLLELKSGFFKWAESQSPGIEAATIKAFEEMFGQSMGITNTARFHLRTRQALINSGRIILTPNGKTIPEIVAEGLDVRPMSIDKEVEQGNDVFTQRSLNCEVAIDPEHYILSSSVGLPPQDQNAELERFKAEVEAQFHGATAIKGNAVTHIHLALIKVRRDRRDFNRIQPNRALVQTSSEWTPYGGGSMAIVSPLKLDRDRKLNVWVQPLPPELFDLNHKITKGGSVRIGVAPLIVPTQTR